MARLPVPGSDSGTWGTILNEFLEQAHDSGGALLANSVGSSQIQTDAVTSSHVANGALPQAKVTNLTTDLAAKVDTTDFRLTPSHMNIYPLQQGYGFFAASEAPSMCDASSDTGVGSLIGIRIWVPANNAITNLSAYVSTAGTLAAGGVNGFAIYTDAGSLVAQSATDNSLWASTGWRTKALSSVIAAQAADRFVYGCFLVSGYSGSPHILWNSTQDGVVGSSPGGTNKRSFYLTGQSSFPASFNPATVGTTNGFMPLIGLS